MTSGTPEAKASICFVACAFAAIPGNTKLTASSRWRTVRKERNEVMDAV